MSAKILTELLFQGLVRCHLSPPKSPTKEDESVRGAAELHCISWDASESRCTSMPVLHCLCTLCLCTVYSISFIASLVLVFRSTGFSSHQLVPPSSAPRATSAHSHSARKVRLQSNQTQLFREADAIVPGRGEGGYGGVSWRVQ
ncbi:hypothetical protein EYF80_031584 [Liparis tanakae]|uniref:Uncharacterized protein n=1 Tax=Liparis tanakae TaxID=230148 RepID=A0A4Z2H055_9TELE|nr:hypothetical protein EYF80_031584 [Liparis tanakae]